MTKGLLKPNWEAEQDGAVKAEWKDRIVEQGTKNIHEMTLKV